MKTNNQEQKKPFINENFSIKDNTKSLLKSLSILINLHKKNQRFFQQSKLEFKFKNHETTSNNFKDFAKFIGSKYFFVKLYENPVNYLNFIKNNYKQNIILFTLLKGICYKYMACLSTSLAEQNNYLQKSIKHIRKLKYLTYSCSEAQIKNALARFQIIKPLEKFFEKNAYTNWGLINFIGLEKSFSEKLKTFSELFLNDMIKEYNKINVAPPTLAKYNLKKIRETTTILGKSSTYTDLVTIEELEPSETGPNKLDNACMQMYFTLKRHPECKSISKTLDTKEQISMKLGPTPTTLPRFSR